MLQEVTGRFLAPDGSPLSGSVVFTPTFLFARDGQAVTLPAPVTARLDAEGRVAASLLVPTPDTEPDAWVWEACPQLRGKHGVVRLRDFAFELTADAPVNLAEVTPVPTSTGEYVTRGRDGKPGADGVGLTAITTEGGELIFTLTDGSESRLPVPQGIPGDDGKPGVGLATITLEDGELVFTLTDGAEQRLPAPVGEKGDDGKPGQPGKDGTSPPAPTLRVGEVTTLPATATATAEITGEAPNYTLVLGIPQGPKGDSGEAAAVKDTGWREITPLVQPPSGADPARNVFESLQVRRVGQTVLVYARFKTNVSNGWTLASEVPGFSSPYTMDTRSGGGIPVLIVGRGIILSGVIANGSSVNFVRCEYTTADPWPVVLPGAPA